MAVYTENLYKDPIRSELGPLSGLNSWLEQHPWTQKMIGATAATLAIASGGVAIGANTASHETVITQTATKTITKVEAPKPPPPTIEPVPSMAAVLAVVGIPGGNDIDLAERRLTGLGLNPAPVKQLAATAKAYGLKPDNIPKELPKPAAKAELSTAVHGLLERVPPKQASWFRARAVKVAQSQLGVRETGYNSGPQINKYTGNHPGEEYCADGYSWVWAQAGLPLFGGKSWGRADSQLGRVLENFKSPDVVSLQQWFMRNAYFFVPGQLHARPQPADAIFLRIHHADKPDTFHVFMAEKVTDKMIYGIGFNTSQNGVSRQNYPINDPDIVGIGSPFNPTYGAK